MIPRKGKLIFFFCLMAIYSNAQQIYQYEITGNKILTKSEISSFVKNFENINDTIEYKNHVTKVVLSNYTDEGYFNVDIKVQSFKIDSTITKVAIDINEGSPTYINKVKIELADSLNENQVADDFYFLTGKIFRRLETEKMIIDLLSEYEKFGYPFAAIKIDNAVFYIDSISEQSNCDLYLKFYKNDKSVIDKIIIEGNSKTKDYVIKRNIRIREGDEFNASKIKLIPEILNRLKYFEPVKPAQYYFDQDKRGILNIEVAEKNTNNFDGILGYVPSKNKNGKGYFTGFVNLGFRNLFGTERMFLFRWQKDGRFSQELEISYTEPWLFDFPLNINLFVWQRKQDSTYVQRKYEAKINYLANEEISLGLIIGAESTIPGNTKNINITKSDAYIIGGLLNYDTRDDILSPQKGFLFNTSYRYYNKKVVDSKTTNTLGSISVRLQKIEFNISYYLSVLERQIIALSLHARELKSNLIEQSDLYKLGGAFSLRGYIENQFMGNRILWSNFEYRYLIERRSYVLLFYDEGYFFLQKEVMKREKSITGFRSGFGAGINIETAIGILGVSFALAKGDSFSDGKVHFGIINEF